VIHRKNCCQEWVSLLQELDISGQDAGAPRVKKFHWTCRMPCATSLKNPRQWIKYWMIWFVRNK
jgi:hypothetical protein